MCFLFQIWQIFEINKKIGQHYRGRPIIGADIKPFYILSISAIFKTDLPIIFFFFDYTNILFTGDIIYWWINNTGEII